MKFIVNEKEYDVSSIGFNTVTNVESLGASFFEITNKPLTVLRAFLAVIGNMSLHQAGMELEEHVVKGNSLFELSQSLLELMEKSDFLQSVAKMTMEKVETKEEVEK